MKVIGSCNSLKLFTERIISFFLHFFIKCVWVICYLLCMCVCTCMPSTHRLHKRAFHILELEIQKTMNDHVGSRNQSPDPLSILVPSENHFKCLLPGRNFTYLYSLLLRMVYPMYLFHRRMCWLQSQTQSKVLEHKLITKGKIAVVNLT